MNTRFFALIGAIALLSLTACTNSAPESSTDETATTTETETTPEVEEPAAMTPELAAGVSLSEDGQTIVMEEFSMLETYCMEGDGKLAISYVGEAGGDDQLVSCGETFETFDTDRENSFAEVNIVPPAIADNALRLEAGEYTRVKCLSNQSSLDSAADSPSDGHMVLNCL